MEALLVPPYLFLCRFFRKACHTTSVPSETMAGKLPYRRGEDLHPLKINQNLHFSIWHTS